MAEADRRRPTLVHPPQVRLGILAEGGIAPAVAPDLRAQGSLTDLVSLMVAPLLRGIPSPVHSRGRAALGKVMLGRVRVEGRLGLMRRLLAIIRI